MASPTPNQRLTLISGEASELESSLADAVREGLCAQPKHLPCRFLYDEHGSLLFEEICELDEYYPTRSERSILEKRAAELATHFPTPPTLVELGSGSATKTRLVIEAILAHHGSLTFVPIDISETMLRASADTLLDDHPELSILGVADEYESGLDQLAHHAAPPRLILWLGSSIGNLHREDAEAFLRSVRDVMSDEDRLLVGIDLRKDRGTLERAYDDSLGVTARFNLNLLARINRELGGDFDLDAFRHRARYREDSGCMEMHLVSQRAQRARVTDLDLEVDFAAGEAIHTENSYKYSPDEIDTLTGASGLHSEARWMDPEDRFSLNLLAPQGALDP